VAKIEAVIKEAIARGARRQMRGAMLPMRRELRRLKRKVAQLQGAMTPLRRSAVGWQRMMASGPPVPRVSEDQAKASRLSPRLIRSLRKRIGLSRMALAKLVGVSAAALAQWESGVAAPRLQNRAALIGLRKVGRREAKELLALKADGAKARRTKRRPMRRRTRARRKGKRGRK